MSVAALNQFLKTLLVALVQHERVRRCARRTLSIAAWTAPSLVAADSLHVRFYDRVQLTRRAIPVFDEAVIPSFRSFFRQPSERAGRMVFADTKVRLRVRLFAFLRCASRSALDRNKRQNTVIIGEPSVTNRYVYLHRIPSLLWKTGNGAFSCAKTNTDLQAVKGAPGGQEQEGFIGLVLFIKRLFAPVLFAGCCDRSIGLAMGVISHLICGAGFVGRKYAFLMLIFLRAWLRADILAPQELPFSVLRDVARPLLMPDGQYISPAPAGARCHLHLHVVQPCR